MKKSLQHLFQHRYKLYTNIIVTLTLILIFTLANPIHSQELHSKKQIKVKFHQIIPSEVLLIKDFRGEDLKKLKRFTGKEVKMNAQASDFVYYKQIPLQKDTQRYIYEQSKVNNIPYELTLSVIKIESNFDPHAISYNGSSYGLMQINKNNTMEWLADETNISNVNPYNPRQSIKMGTWYLGYLKQYWIDKGVSEKNANKAALISYHQGVAGAKQYIRNYGFNSKYTNIILEYKSNLEGDS